jgi:hypothetical protein
MSEKKHLLDISMYSFKELLGLFDMTYDISPEDIKRAKKKVLMLHPDKSRLSSEYFLFYKKALDHIFEYYKTTKKSEMDIANTNTAYISSELNTYDKHTTRKIAETVHKMDTSVFNQKFNKIFEDNVVSNKKQPSRNNWFKEEAPVLNLANVNTKNVNGAIHQIKTENKQMLLAKYTGIQTLNSGSGTDLYDDMGEDSDEESPENSAYITSDPFSKLKFDDLRKVHKDQTIFAVSENDYVYDPATRSSVDSYARTRGQQNLTPMEKNMAEHLLREKEMEHSKKIAQKQYKSTLETKKYEEMNKNILSGFLRVKNA